LGYFPEGYREFSPPQAVGIIEIEYTKGEKCRYNRRFAWRVHMRLSLIILSLLVLTGCTALVVGGAADGNYDRSQNERSSSVVASDAAITNRIEARYVADAVVSAFDIHVRTYKGTVFLSGRVGSFVARDRAAELAKETAGVIAVNNQIVIEDRSK
jgi:hyperosmotically inducible protein